MRTFTRTRSLRTLAAGLVAAGALSLTACSGEASGGVGAAKDAGPATTVSQVSRHAKTDTNGTDTNGTDAGATSTGGTAHDTKGTEGTGSTNGTDGTDSTSRTDRTGGASHASAETASSASAPAGAAKGPTRTACTTVNSKVQVSAVSRPLNHLLLTLTNTSGAPCNAYYAPYVGFDGDQAATQRIEDSKPQAVVTLNPGEHAYASVALGGDGEHSRSSRKVTVSMPGRNDAGTVGGSVTLKAPGGKVYLDDNAAVTYWQSELGDALTW